ncbi:hypothetical protein [Saccharibacillus brassicae]|uniref:Uncharacterized protein n=1 Tax=Saccharibacillus brassicae TaxID=2583377 RepID=A0A4Y6V3K6_SACBS|nr:hypothetical protein [Saccharibacillus brassicae]QDH23438.1 hypothetical protein FFV09_22770 [Saccharibacillus brassicae]
MKKIKAIALAALIVISYLAVLLILVLAAINLFGENFERIKTEFHNSPWMVVSIGIYTVIMSLYFVHVRKKDFLYLKSFYHIFILPVGIVVIVLSMISFNPSTFTLIQELVFIAVILFGISAVTCIFVLRERHNSDLISASRVLLEYLDVFYWILFSVIVFVFEFSWKEVLQFFTIPFLIQTKITKAIIGHLKSGVVKKRGRMGIYIADGFWRIIDFKNPHKKKKIIKREIRRIP